MATTPATAADPEPVQAGITVPRVEGMGEDWINGVDVSTVLSLEESGVQFFDFDGNEADLFEVLADAGVNWARIRVWNQPYSSADPSLGYGAGNVDAARATEIGQRATDAGMQVLVDFHYSDFWAHPGQQYSPRAWRGMDLSERTEALHDYTVDTLTMMREAGVAVGMVQIGNETTGGEIAGVSGWKNTAQLFQAGSEAVHEVYGDEVKVAVHFTNPERAGQYASVARELDERGVDYDVFLSSYYPFWHGSLDNLTTVLDQVATTYDKEVAVAETSWVHTLEDGDGQPNSVDTVPEAYSASVQGQALAVRDVMQAVADVSDDRGLGTFYWEPAWLPVGPPEAFDANWQLWQEFGSGWASTYSQEFYDPDGALGEEWADDFGGSGWDNQALFGFDGRPLESLRVYEYAVTGSIGPREFDSVADPSLTVVDGEPIQLPDQVRVSYTDGTSELQSVTWAGDVSWILGPGTYTVAGDTADGYPVTATVIVRAELGAGENLVVNPGFEDGEDPWTGTGTGYTIAAWDDPYEGERSTHFFAEDDYSFAIEQRLTGVPAGDYVLSARAQGGHTGPEDALQITASSGISTVSADYTLTGWGNWQSPQTGVLTVAADGVVTVRAEATLSGGAWGTLDAFSFTEVSEADEVDLAELRELVAEAGAVDRAAYTADSVAVLDAALARAAFVLEAPEPGQASVDGAVAELRAALDELVAADDDAGAGGGDASGGGDSNGGGDASGGGDTSGGGVDGNADAAAGGGADAGDDGTADTASGAAGSADSGGQDAVDPAADGQEAGDQAPGDLSRTGATVPLALIAGLLAAGAVLLLVRKRTQRG